MSSRSSGPPATVRRSSTSCSSSRTCRSSARRAPTPASSRISANINVGPDCYANQILADSAAVLTDAIANDTGRFDASDLMPGEVGAGSFWTGMVQYMQDGPDSLQGILEEIDSSWPSG